ncbi:MAG: aspartate kinase [Candidatus Jettenia sp.]|uniref:Aspartokinase n=1 Tax=Candidatus Jettenia caeni TaxID=247490 RepID=I3IMC9_9BACT|nr:aspartate kinase [Candidatus Jettenia sp. AMX1]MBC6927753.1 aspartate kinase [Candidatus Jettenia sp.]WKZ14618.1 MAG: aspartate kinase [Candidatus Jettenia caeni]KAA0251437.1 MAG: aspartate kinase [Candidatus Jettenia sp. AMX1]MCE7879419.1 aspartate kinase [Candidatus Jettenia sp. AMX1]MDL1938368.1 aspartate kinase [Candidatus Jettenia sp. AMX1]
MGLIVQKFGGTSVANAERIRAAAKRIIETYKAGNKVIVVVSARGQTTDELIDLAYELTDNPSTRELDMLMSTGEQISIALVAMAIHALGYPAVSFTGGQVGIITDSYHTKARIRNISTNRIQKELENGTIVIVAGFQGVDANENITTLGRGGSDTTAVALASIMGADRCDIFTDVDGIYTADPRKVPYARKLDKVSYDEILELASLGAQVMHSRSIEFAKKYNVPLYVRSSFNNSEGTLICKEVKEMEDIVVSGVAVSKEDAKITIRAVPDVPGQAAKIFHEIARRNINVDMIIQNASIEGRADVTFTVPRSDLRIALETAEKIKNDLGAKEVMHDSKIAKLSVVGIGMRSHCGVAEKMFSVLADEKINIQMISTSEIKISCVIDDAHADRALRAVHTAFGLDKVEKEKEEIIKV